jgi:SOS-response transcriptional repressor LexA
MFMIIEEYILLPTAAFGKGGFCKLHVSGNLITDAGIDDDDLVSNQETKLCE